MDPAKEDVTPYNYWDMIRFVFTLFVDASRA